MYLTALVFEIVLMDELYKGVITNCVTLVMCICLESIFKLSHRSWFVGSSRAMSFECFIRQWDNVKDVMCI